MTTFKNVFILCTGRCGSTTIIRACEHLTNYTAAHESRTPRLGDERFAYPEGHIEADNRLSWLLARLDAHFGSDAFYVHLRRDREKVASSYANRAHKGIFEAYRGNGILMGNRSADRVSVAADMVDTITANIDYFLRDKPHQMEIWLETAKQQMPEFFERIGAQGDVDAALAEFDVRHNPQMIPPPKRKSPLASRALRRMAHEIEKRTAK